MIVDITTSSGVDFIQPFIYETTTGTPISLVGLTLNMMVRLNATDATALISLSSAGKGIIITNAAAGMFTIWITRASLLTLDAGNYLHSLVQVNPDGTITEIWHGTLTQTVGITR